MALVGWLANVFSNALSALEMPFLQCRHFAVALNDIGYRLVYGIMVDRIEAGPTGYIAPLQVVLWID